MIRKTGPTALSAAAFLLVAASLISCSPRRALNVFFDIPPKAPAEKEPVPGRDKPPAAEGQQPAKTDLGARAGSGARPAPAGTPREKLPAEKELVWAKVEPLLPKDPLGEVDWMEALRTGVIDPKASTEPGTEPFVLKFDFHWNGPLGTLGAYFPHSAHTQWLTCESCHPKIFPQPGTPLSMAKVLSGDYCGKCHLKVAFPIAKGCIRCHANKS
ncbi:MAG: hypothetical protein HY900_33610 [Deltaproteobacteria bacterium]|nr:hypothetical protein [Deltaproteobacteria bacterium]